MKESLKSILNFLNPYSKTSAKTAKERLQIVVSHQRNNDTSPDFLPSLRKELLDVICKYITIDIEKINVNLQKEGNCSVLELNVTIPEPIDDNYKKEPSIKEENIDYKDNTLNTPTINDDPSETEEEELMDVEIADI